MIAERFRWLAIPGLALAFGACGSSSNVVAPSLSASCAATPSSGPAPLLVRFTLDVAGAEGSFAVSIDYGDGGSGSDAAAPHTYANAGSFTATFRVATASQSAQCSTVVQAAPHAPPPTPPPPPTGPNQPPNAVFRTTPLPDDTGRFVSDPSSDPPLVISFNMCPTSDPEGDPLLFRMDLDGDGRFEEEGSTGADCRHSYEYDVPGTYAPRICVTDLSPQSLSPRHGFQCQSYVVEILDSEAQSRRRGAAHVAPRR